MLYHHEYHLQEVSSTFVAISEYALPIYSTMISDYGGNILLGYSFNFE